MGLKLFNTLSCSAQEFAPLDPPKVGMYCCGPTVYDFAHIGNWRTFVFADLVRRYLEFKNFQVTHVMNITDIEDKIIKRVRELKIPLRDFTGKFETAFFEDLKTLNSKPRAPPNTFPKSFRSSKNSSRAVSPTKPATVQFISQSRNIAAAAANTASC
jgi:cysteinyl-tRNA synthetase